MAGPQTHSSKLTNLDWKFAFCETPLVKIFWKRLGTKWSIFPVHSLPPSQDTSSMPLLPLCLLFSKTLVILFKTPLDLLEWPHLRILNCIHKDILAGSTETVLKDYHWTQYIDFEDDVQMCPSGESCHCWTLKGNPYVCHLYCHQHLRKKLVFNFLYKVHLIF